MKKIDSYFNDFLSEIRLTKSQRDDLISGHTTLRDRLLAFEGLKDIIVTTFLQGSYRRSTAIRPLGEKRADVDIIIVTNLDRNKVTPHEALNLFIPFVEKHYKGKYKLQGRSIGIELSYVDLDIVVTSAPSEVDLEALKSQSVTTNMMLEDSINWRLIKSWREVAINGQTGSYTLSEAELKEAEWKLEPLHIPDRDAGLWEETHPLEQIKWTRDKNRNTNGHFVNIVKALKWWRTLRLDKIKYPKGYPIEHMIGDCCNDNISNIAEGVCSTLENIVTTYRDNREANTVPNLPDRGVPGHNVWKRISSNEFNTFYDEVVKYAKIARKALDANTLKEQSQYWREIFGDKFPLAPDDNSGGGNNGGNNPKGSGGFTERTKVTVPPIGGGRFA